MELLESGYYYHIYNHANGNENLFLEEDNYIFFLNKYYKFIGPIADTFAYCLMPNHFHFLLRIKDNFDLTFPKVANKDLQGFENLGGLISKQFSNFFNSYSKAFNKKYHRRGSLFNQNFKRKKITTEQYLKQAINYIHQNPVHHEFVDKPQMWKYSSYNSIISNKPTRIKKDEIINWFDDLENFKVYHKLKTIEIYLKELELEY